MSTRELIFCIKKISIYKTAKTFVGKHIISAGAWIADNKRSDTLKRYGNGTEFAGFKEEGSVCKEHRCMEGIVKGGEGVVRGEGGCCDGGREV